MSKHAWMGSCDPQRHGGFTGTQTFSVGVFEWLPRKSGLGQKPGKVKVRVAGNVSEAQKVYDKATEICAALDAETYRGPKTVRA